MLLFYYFTILTSILGYGTFVNEKVINYKTYNLGQIGLIGIFSLLLISYISTQFLAHSKTFNLIVFFLGNLFFFKYFLNKKYSKKNIKIVIYLSLLMVISIFIFKNHDDFSYYHFPYILMLTEGPHPIGIGKVNIGFNTHSSIFLLSSMFYLPASNYNLFHLPAVYFMLFGNLFIITKILNEKFKQKFILYFQISSLVFINIFFYRIAEHGTDRSAMILIIIFVSQILFILNRNFEKDDLNQLKFIFILLATIISLKAFYILYIIFLIPILKKIYKKTIILKILKSNYFLLSLSLFIFVLLTNFFNSGCLLFPEAKTCFQNLQWGMSIEKVEEYRIHYENWAKAGAGAGYTNIDKIGYIKNLNWIPNWIDKYFFNKMSDFLLSIIFIIIILFFIFKTKKTKKIINNKYLPVYVLTVFLVIIWFFNYPALRYGGYNLFFIIFFLPFSIFIQKYVNVENKFKKKITFILIITCIIFLGRNVNRIYDENIKYLYNPFQNTSYRLEKSSFRFQNMINNIKNNNQEKLIKVYKDRYIIKK